MGKGLSLDEKRERILQFFHETDGVFQLKEVEKEAVKRGVTLQSVKDVVQSLVDDNLVNQEKIGISNFLWSFAGQASTKLQNEEVSLRREVESLAKEQEQLSSEIEVERAKQDAPDENLRLQNELWELKQQKATLLAELSELEVVDPERHKAMHEACITAKQSANRWLDNLYSIKDWVNKKFPGREGDVNKFFEEEGLTENVGYFD